MASPTREFIISQKKMVQSELHWHRVQILMGFTFELALLGMATRAPAITYSVPDGEVDLPSVSF